MSNAFEFMFRLGLLNAQCRAQAFLPAASGGFGILDPTVAAPLACVSARLQVWPMVVDALVRVGVHRERAAALLDLDHARAASEVAGVLGVFVDACGNPCSEPPRAPLCWNALPASDARSCPCKDEI